MHVRMPAPTNRKDMEVYEESDEYCPHCDNQYVLPAKTPNAALVTEGEADVRIDSRAVRDERMEQRQRDVR